VGISGSTTLRVVVVAPSALSRPACTSAIAVAGTMKPPAICPFRIAVVTCGLPG
jgi:hypothetical protein